VEDVFRVIQETPQHKCQILTKRPSRARALAARLDWPPNLWLGVSVENAQVVQRIDVLRQLPAAVRFLSCEPLLGPLPDLNLTGVGSVIVGGESGPGARPMASEWVTQVRDQCLTAAVPFFFKQWGGRTPKAKGRHLDGRVWDEMPARLLA
jgi:protein gp37